MFRNAFRILIGTLKLLFRALLGLFEELLIELRFEVVMVVVMVVVVVKFEQGPVLLFTLNNKLDFRK